MAAAYPGCICCRLEACGPFPVLILIVCRQLTSRVLYTSAAAGGRKLAHLHGYAAAPWPLLQSKDGPAPQVGGDELGRQRHTDHAALARHELPCLPIKPAHQSGLSQTCCSHCASYGQSKLGGCSAGFVREGGRYHGCLHIAAQLWMHILMALVYGDWQAHKLLCSHSSIGIAHSRPSRDSLDRSPMFKNLHTFSLPALTTESLWAGRQRDRKRQPP